MKGIASDIINVLNEYKSMVNIKKRDMLAASRLAANLVSTNDNTVKPEIKNSSDTQDKSTRQNVFLLTSIGVKEVIA